MDKVAHFVTKYAKVIIILVLLITLFGITQIKYLKVEDDITKYLAENDPEIRFYQEVSKKFGKYDKDMTLVSLEYDDLFTLDNLQNFKLITDTLTKSNHIIKVDSFLNMPKIIITDYGIEVRQLVEVFPETEEEAQELKRTALEDKMLKGTYLSEDGKVALLSIKSPDNINGAILKKELEEVINKYRGNIKHVEIFGLPIMETQITEMARANMSLAFIATILVLALLFYCFRSLQGTLLPISIALLTSFWLLSWTASSGQKVTIVISAIPVLMIALVTAYGIHYISRYYEYRHLFPPQESLQKTIVSVFIPIMMSALTTMAGFASLTGAVIRPMTEFGILATGGILVAFLLNIFLLGAILSIFIPKKVPQNFSYQANDLVTRLLKIIAQSLFLKKNWVFGIILIILICSGFFALQVKPDSSIESRLGLNNPITKTMNYFKEKFGGVDFLYIYISAENVKHPYILRCMDKIQNFAGTLTALGQPSSITTFLSQLNEAMENKKIIPANPDKIDNLWFFAGDNEYINSLLADNNQSTIIQIRAREMTSSAVNSAIEKINQFIQELPNKVRKIDLSSLSREEKSQYFAYIVHDIISSWHANGMQIDSQKEDKISQKLFQVAGLPIEEFVTADKEFVAELLNVSALELEDMGISINTLRPLILEYLINYPDDSFLDNLSKKLDLSIEDAQYLKEILDSSKSIVGERQKIRYLQTEIENILNTKLNQENANYLWYLTDEYFYIPDNEGDISFSYRLTGTPVILNEVNRSVFQGQMKSMLIAFIVVFILLILQFGSLSIGSIAMIPIFCTILTAFGIMGLSGISLNIGTMMVASIAIGAGIDYTIHFINRYRQELISQNNEYSVALQITLTGTGRAIVFNSLSVAAGAFVLSLSEINMISEFARLIGSLMLISVVYTLVLLPLLLYLYTAKKSKKSI